MRLSYRRSNRSRMTRCLVRCPLRFSEASQGYLHRCCTWACVAIGGCWLGIAHLSHSSHTVDRVFELADAAGSDSCR